MVEARCAHAHERRPFRLAPVMRLQAAVWTSRSRTPTRCTRLYPHLLPAFSRVGAPLPKLRIGPRSLSHQNAMSTVGPVCLNPAESPINAPYDPEALLKASNEAVKDVKWKRDFRDYFLGNIRILCLNLIHFCLFGFKAFKSRLFHIYRDQRHNARMLLY